MVLAGTVLAGTVLAGTVLAGTVAGTVLASLVLQHGWYRTSAATSAAVRLVPH